MMTHIDGGMVLIGRRFSNLSMHKGTQTIILVCIIQIKTANSIHPKFISKAGATKIINVGATGRTVTAKAATNMMTMRTTNFTLILALFLLNISTISNCSITYP